jgi:hypothetical protein
VITSSPRAGWGAPPERLGGLRPSSIAALLLARASRASRLSRHGWRYLCRRPRGGLRGRWDRLGNDLPLQLRGKRYLLRRPCEARALPGAVFGIFRESHLPRRVRGEIGAIGVSRVRIRQAPVTVPGCRPPPGSLGSPARPSLPRYTPRGLLREGCALGHDSCQRPLPRGGPPGRFCVM